MFRLYDWECPKCGFVAEGVVEFPQGAPPPLSQGMFCGSCGKTSQHRRMLPKVGKYLKDRSFNYAMCGGNYDTMGYKQGPSLPDLPGSPEFDQKCQDFVSTLPMNLPPKKIHQEVESKFGGEAPTLDDYGHHFRTKEYQEAKAERERVKAENRQKRKRAAAIKRGDDISMHTSKCAGDPNILGD